MTQSRFKDRSTTDEITLDLAQMVSQEIVYQYIRRYLKQHGFPPSVRDIAQACQLGATTVFYHLGKLEAAGRISRRPHKARSLQLAKKSRKIEQN